MEPANYLIATDLLPEEELRKLSELLEGRSAYLWVPSRETLNRQKRDKYILHLRGQGLTTQEIADRLLISVRQVRRVLAKNRAASLPSLAGQD